MNDSLTADKAEWVMTVLRDLEGPLLRYAARITGSVEQARDVVQETFLRLCGEEAASLNGRLPQWLYTVCRNQALDVKRKSRRMTTTIDEKNKIGAGERILLGEDPAAIVEGRESASGVLRLLYELPENQQEVVHLRFQGQLSYKQIAEVTGLSVTNVGYLIHTAIAALRTGMTNAEL